MAKTTTTTLTSRELNQDVGRAKRAARNGPVFITHRGQRSHVLLSIEEYERLMGDGGSIVERLAMPGAEDGELEARRLSMPLARPADLS